MLGIQLATLSVPELRRLLGVARERGQETLVRQLEEELAGRQGRFAGQTLPSPMAAVPARDQTAAPRPRMRRSRAPAIAVGGGAAFVGAALAWGLTLTPPQDARPRPQSVALAAGETPTRVAVALTEVRLPEEAPDQPISEPAAPGPDDPPPAASPSASSGHNPCYDLPTARERLVCGYPSLAIEDRRMKAALARARANDTDPAAVDDEQAEWLAASAEISDRLVLAQRYARRTAELEAR